MIVAALAPVRVPAGRQGGPRTHLRRRLESRELTSTKNHYKRVRTGPVGRSFSSSARPVIVRIRDKVGMPGTRLPMFPLSAVLFPHASMPLHVFESRYRVLMRDCLEGDRASASC